MAEFRVPSDIALNPALTLRVWVFAGRRATGQAAQLEQFQPESLDLGEHAVQRGLIRDGALQKRVAVLDLSVKIRERAPQSRA
jgi:hypothetical protein